MPDRDGTSELMAAVAQALEANEPLIISGSGSKSFLTASDTDRREPTGLRLLSVAEHAGIIDYQPDELVITARAGTPLRELRQQLEQHDQMLPFEPPLFRGGGTLGGAVAAGLSGPGRPWWGSVRDSVLGVEMINGAGERVRFGGQVMKNVAGYDVSRLVTGAFGTLGVLLAISVRVRPKPQSELTVRLAVNGHEALRRQRAWRLLPLPISATCYFDGELSARLSGAEAAVVSAAGHLGGEQDHDTSRWQRLAHHDHDFFRGDRPVWRVAGEPAARLMMDDAEVLMEWAGALRWYSGVEDTPRGADLDRAGDRFDSSFAAGRFTRLPAQVRHIQRRLKAAFDPSGLFNPHLVAPHAD